MNSGDALAENVKVQVFIDDKMIGQHTIAQIMVNGSVRAIFQWEGSSGTHNIKVSIDPDNSINESNEINNIAVTKVEIGSGNGFNNDLADQLMWLCLGVIIIIIVIILILIVAATKLNRRKDQQPQYYGPYQYGNVPPGPQYGQYQYPAGSTVGATTPPKPPVPGRGGPQTGTKPFSDRPSCKRCGGTKIRHLDDGRWQCQSCKNIFL